MQRSILSPRLSPLSVRISRPRTASLSRAAVGAALAVGIVLRGALLHQPGLHPDEALYASWALRIADGSDPALLAVYVDKPPLALYLLAALFRLAGFDGQALLHPGQLILAGRLAALMASAVSLALLWLIARRVYGARVALAALTLLALSPLAVKLAPTLFTDPWLTLWLLAGLLAALGQRAWLAGIACGLAYATKQQGVLFLPLVLAVLLLSQPQSAPRGTSEALSRRRLAWRWLNGFAIVAVAVLWWDSLRWQWMPSYWDRSAQTYGGLALALDAGLTQRLAQWGELLSYGFGWPFWLAAAGLVFWAAASVVTRRATTRQSQQPAFSRAEQAWRPLAADSVARWFDRLLLAYVLSYLLLHIVTNLAPWDRYLLPLAPLLALLLARALFWAWDVIPQPAGRVGWGRAVAGVGLAAGLLYAGYLAGFARLPLSDGGAYDGVQQIAAHVRSTEKSDAILYHHWLGWHYNFYLYGAPVELRWWQDPADLTRKAAAAPGQRQLIAFPAGRSEDSVRAALAGAGLALSPVLQAADAHGAPSVMLYSIEPLVAGAPDYGP